MGNGKSLGYFNWIPGQPDNWISGQEPEACIQIVDSSLHNQWNDARCAASYYYFICEEDPSCDCSDKKENPTIIINTNANANANANTYTAN